VTTGAADVGDYPRGGKRVFRHSCRVLGSCGAAWVPIASRYANFDTFLCSVASISVESVKKD